MKHVQIDNNGRYRYRRRVPEVLKKLVGKGEFVKVLGQSENEALSNYGTIHRHCEHLIALAKDGVVAPSPMVQKEQLEALLRNWGADPYSSGRDDNEITWRDIHADSILDKYKQDPDTGRPIGVSKEDEALVGAVRHQRFWFQRSRKLSEYLAHLVESIMRLTCGVASAGFRVFCV